MLLGSSNQSPLLRSLSWGTLAPPSHPWSQKVGILLASLVSTLWADLYKPYHLNVRSPLHPVFTTTTAGAGQP